MHWPFCFLRGLDSLKLKKKKRNLDDFHKALEGLISVFFDYCVIK